MIFLALTNKYLSPQKQQCLFSLKTTIRQIFLPACLPKALASIPHLLATINTKMVLGESNILRFTHKNGAHRQIECLCRTLVITVAVQKKSLLLAVIWIPANLGLILASRKDHLVPIFFQYFRNTIK